MDFILFSYKRLCTVSFWIRFGLVQNQIDFDACNVWCEGVNVAIEINVFVPKANALASTVMLGVIRPLQFFKLLEPVVMDTVYCFTIHSKRTITLFN